MNNKATVTISLNDYEDLRREVEEYQSFKKNGEYYSIYDFREKFYTILTKDEMIAKLSSAYKKAIDDNEEKRKRIVYLQDQKNDSINVNTIRRKWYQIF